MNENVFIFIQQFKLGITQIRAVTLFLNVIQSCPWKYYLPASLVFSAEDFVTVGNCWLQVLKKRREYVSSLKDDSTSESSMATVSPYREWLAKSASIPRQACGESENVQKENCAASLDVANAALPNSFASGYISHSIRCELISRKFFDGEGAQYCKMFCLIIFVKSAHEQLFITFNSELPASNQIHLLKVSVIKFSTTFLGLGTRAYHFYFFLVDRRFRKQQP